MAVEAPHMTLNPSQFLPNRDMIDHQPNAVTYGIAPLPMIPMYGAGMTDSFPTPAFKADSGLTSSLPRKRPRHEAHVSSFTPPFSLPNAPMVNQNEHGTFAFFGEDIASHIYQQQLEIDRFVSHHTEKVRTEIQEMRKRNSRRLIAAAQEGIMKRLKAKEDEIVKIGQMNWSLEEKVKSLNVENQIWRELAETNEATANALRNNLQQVQEQLQLQQHYSLDFNNNCASIDDAQSHCGSNHELDRMLAEESGGERKNSSRYGGMNRRCRNCGKEESCVLLLPCRHLCMCTICASSISICPVCKSKKSAGVHVNMN